MSLENYKPTIVNYRPERKIVAAAIATVAVAVFTSMTDVTLDAGVEGALAVIAAYLIPGGE